MTGKILIRGGMVMDGSGEPAERADVLVDGDRIEDVGQFPEARAGRGRTSLPR